MSTNQNYIKNRKHTEEYKRLQENRNNSKSQWKKWGPYLSDRQWSTVREDYSKDGKTWKYFNYDHARSRAYRWGEDGIFGISDDQQRLCFALTLWNDNDPHLKERFFGLPGFEGDNCGNHMEDVKEYYFYLDNTPTHSYMKALYKYPYEFPYQELIDENNKLQKNEFGGKDKPEYELIDTGCFDQGYFDVVVEYAKNDTDDILIKITVWNQVPEPKENRVPEAKENQVPNSKKLHIIPTLWFRNTWSWSGDAEKEKQKLGLQVEKVADNVAAIKAHHSELGDYYLYCKDLDTEKLLFTENETNNERVFQTSNTSKYVKDGINNYVVDQQNNKDKVNPEQKGTKASAHYTCNLNEKESQVIWLRLTNSPDKLPNGEPFGDDFEGIFDNRKKEADDFYDAVTPFSLSDQFSISDQERQIQRQAFAGILWNKQFYYYVVQDWLNGDFKDRKSHKIYPPLELLSSEESEARKSIRNSGWNHLHGEDIIIMPDKWEFPYFCVWDSAFHAVTLALIDPDFAKEQILLFTKPWYMKKNGQIPSCEFNFDELNPPILAWAALKVDEIEQEIYGPSSDQSFLPLIFDNLQKNLEWWFKTNKLDKKPGAKKDNYLFGAGFLGLDNISIVDRNQFLNPKQGNESEQNTKTKQETKKSKQEKNTIITIEQIDATSWIAMFYLNMLTILTKLDEEEQKKREDEAKDFLEKFILICHEINEIVDDQQIALWDKNDNFYYEVLKISLKKFSLEFPLKYRSLLGIIPLFAVAMFTRKKETYLTRILRSSFHDLKSFFSNPDSSFSKQFIDKDGKLQKEGLQYLLGEEECIDIRQDSSKDVGLFLSIVNRRKLQNIIDKLLDKDEFLSDYGIRSLSKIHKENPYKLDGIINIEWNPGNVQTFPIEMKYEPAEAITPVHIGNSNWRGPIWFPMNFLIIDSLNKFHEYFKNFGVLFPSVSHHKVNLKQVAIELSKRLIKIFVYDSRKRAVYGDNPKIYKLFKTPDGQDLILFYEYFNGDTGQGLGASHQTGWTGLVANLIYQVGKDEYEKAESEK
ncbi:MAG: glucosidase [Xenococcus sp. MO_188.B8]|nr:glucosidase [Xenococcus sp. MO_188.B8]